MSATTSSEPQYVPMATTWAVDTTHSNVEFSIKYLMISTMKGVFRTLEGMVNWDGTNFDTASVDVQIDAASITMFNDALDDRIRMNDFLDTEQWPEISFVSARIEPIAENRFAVHGDLTLRGITRPVTLDTDFDGLVERDVFGKRRAAFTATTEIQRADYGIVWNVPMETGGVAVSDAVKITMYVATVALVDAV
jgi:polyisoprenoid-binding protein YceI